MKFLNGTTIVPPKNKLKQWKRRQRIKLAIDLAFLAAFLTLIITLLEC